MKKCILILNTGGTISCLRTAKGLEPVNGHVEMILATSARLKHHDLPHYLFQEHTPLLDSSNMTLSDWNQIAREIQSAYDKVDGFIILHGTDTMAYTAAALSFMLEDLGKPVILTGSQLPLGDVRSDAMDNIITSLYLCAQYPIPEVCVYFNNRLLRGNRARKMNTHGFDAFDSPNLAPLAKAGIDIQVKTTLVEPKTNSKFHIQPLKPTAIANFRLFPGFDIALLRALMIPSLDALILETYGTGNASNHDPAFFEVLKQAEKRNIITINSTQCPKGRVEMSHYATGIALEEIGVLSARDMTPEAIYGKLLYVCAKTKDVKKRKKLMTMPLRGEMS